MGDPTILKISITQHPHLIFFSCLYSNLIINVIFPIFLVYPLHLTILSHRNETKRASLMLHSVRLAIYIHIELNLIPMVATLVLIIIKIFLFVVSTEISVTLKQNYIDTKFLENSYVVFKLNGQINCFKLTIQKTLL